MGDRSSSMPNSTLPPDQIKEFQVQFRPFEEAEIKGIALDPRPVSASTSKPRTESPRQKTDPTADSDGDGLTDFQEIHKYRTDPSEVQHGRRRRLRRRPPAPQGVHLYDPVGRQGDAAGERGLHERRLPGRPRARHEANFVELEVIHYPLNTNAEAIAADPDWRRRRRVDEGIPRAPASPPTGTTPCAATSSRRSRPTASIPTGSTTASSSPGPPPG